MLGVQYGWCFCVNVFFQVKCVLRRSVYLKGCEVVITSLQLQLLQRMHL